MNFYNYDELWIRYAVNHYDIDSIPDVITFMF